MWEQRGTWSADSTAWFGKWSPLPCQSGFHVLLIWLISCSLGHQLRIHGCRLPRPPCPGHRGLALRKISRYLTGRSPWLLWTSGSGRCSREGRQRLWLRCKQDSECSSWWTFSSFSYVCHHTSGRLSHKDLYRPWEAGYCEDKYRLRPAVSLSWGFTDSEELLYLTAAWSLRLLINKMPGQQLELG